MKNILKPTLIISLIGIFLLLSLANILNPKLTTIDQITNKQINKNIKVSGEIFNIKSYEEEDFQVISIKDETGKIDITINKIIDLQQNQNITVTGKIKEYNKFLQIQADKIFIQIS